MENQLLKKSGRIAAIVTLTLLGAWFDFSKFSLGAYNEKNLTKQFLAEDSMVFNTIVIEVGTGTLARIVAGTASMTLTGTATYPGQPRIEYNGATGLWSFKNAGGTTTTAFGTVTADYVAAQIGSTAANYVLQNNGSSTGQLVTNPTLAGQGTITATFNANGLDITPAEYASVNNATSEFQAQITETKGSVTNHTHTGSDGTAKVSHTDLTPASKGTQTHTQIDDFIASKAQASGLASLDANSLVIQNPASASKTPGTSTIVMTGSNTDRIADAFLSNNITKLGTPTTDSINEGSTNLYYTNNRVNAAIGSTTLETLLDVGTGSDGQFLKKVGASWVGAASVVTTYWADVLGHPADGTTGNSYVSKSAAVDTIPMTDANGNLRLVGNIVGSETVTNLNPTRINFAGTITQVTGTQTSPVWYTLKEAKVNASGIHSSPNVLLYIPADAGGSSTTFTDTSSYQAAVTAKGGAVSSSNYSKFGGASYWSSNSPYGYLEVATSTTGRYNIFGTDSCYISAFVKMTSVTANITLFSLDAGSTMQISYQGAGGLGLALRVAPGVQFTQGDTAGWSVNTEYHIALRKFANGGYQMFRDGVLLVVGTDSTAWSTAGNPHIGNDTGLEWYWRGYIDDFYWEKNTDGTSTVPTSAKSGTLTIYYNSYSSYYIPSNASTPFLTILDDGTNSVKPQVVIGSTTSSSTSTTGIKLEVSGKLLAIQLLSPSEEKKKVVYPDRTVNYLDELKNIRIGEWSWRENEVNRIDAEDIAKKDYIQSNKKSWIAANKANYSSTVLEPGTGTVTKVDKVKMDKDYKTYIELEWTSLPNQEELINEVENKLEAGDNPEIHIGAFAGDPTTPAILQSKSKKELILNDQIGWNIKVSKELYSLAVAQQKEIGSLTVALENLRVINNLK